MEEYTVSLVIEHQSKNHFEKALGESHCIMHVLPSISHKGEP